MNGESSISEGRKMKAIELYRAGKVSLGFGAKIAGVRLSEFFDLLETYRVPLRLTLEDAKDAMGHAERTLHGPK